MARTVRDARLQTRTARSRLPIRHEPHWKAIDAGMHLGYRKGARKASWVARYRTSEGRYLKTVLGIADDIQDSDGTLILSFSQAQERGRQWFAEQTRKSDGAEPGGPYTVADAMRDYLSWCAGEKKRGLANIRYWTDAFILPELGDVEVADLKTKRIREWHHGLAAQPPRARTRPGAAQQFRKVRDGENPEYIRRRQATVNKVLTILKAALNQAWSEGKVGSDAAWRRVKPFRNVDAPRVRYLTGDECARLTNACSADFRKLVIAALLTGARYGELTALRCGDFNTDTGSIHIRMSKSGKPRDVPLNSEGVQFFLQLTAGRPGDELAFLRADGQVWGRSHQRRRVEAAAKAANLHGLTFHILRHCYGSTLAREGVALRVIADLLGHSDSRITEKHYSHLAPSYVADVVRRNLPRLGIVEESKIAILKR